MKILKFQVNVWIVMFNANCVLEAHIVKHVLVLLILNVLNVILSNKMDYVLINVILIIILIMQMYVSHVMQIVKLALKVQLMQMIIVLQENCAKKECIRFQKLKLV